MVLIDEVFDFETKGVKFRFALNPEAEGALSVLKESTRKKGYLVSYVRVKFLCTRDFSKLTFFLSWLS